MELQNSQQRTRTQEREQIKQQTIHQESTIQCARCGTQNAVGSAFCENCGAPLGTSHCPGCGAPLDPDVDYCEQCGTHIIGNKCPFCGETMSTNDFYCPECGAPKGGIVCPTCHQSSTFGFCPGCGTPLTESAQRELEKVRNQPIYTEMEHLMHEYEELERVIPINTEQQVEREKRNQDLRRRVLELLNQGVTMARSKEIYGAGLTSESLSVLIEQKRKELQEILSRMEMPRQQNAAKARNYAMACKPSSGHLGWKCNYKQAIHNSPCECAYPHLGGKWIVKNDENK